jgi:hypothetical protein
VMVVVAHAALVERRRPRGFDPTDEAVVGQDTEGVVDRLARDRPDLGTRVFRHPFRRAVGMARDGTQHGQSLGRHVQAVLAEQGGEVRRHGSNVRHNLDGVQTWTRSTSTVSAVLLGSKSIARSGARARAQIMATRESLQAALELQEADIPEISQAIARLERVEAELDRIEAGIAVREGLA